MRRRLLAMAAAVPLMIAADKNAPPDAGPDPTYVNAVVLSEAAIRELVPDARNFEWPYNFVRGTLKAPLGKTRAGWYTCGKVTGWINHDVRRVWVLMMINNGIVTVSDIGLGDGIDPATMSCESILKQGLLPLAPGPAPVAGSAPAVPAAPPPPADPAAVTAFANKSAGEFAARGGIGIAYVPMPTGATIMGVGPGSPADKAGLKPGETIETVNGVPLKGRDQAGMMQVFSNAGNPIVVEVTGVGKVTINR